MASACASPGHDPEEPVDGVVRLYLAKYGYSAVDASNWNAPPSSAAGSEQVVRPVLELRVVGHEEQDGHTWYTLECSLGLPGGRCLRWCTSKRLVQLREALHDPVKSELKRGTYKEHFGSAPFAHKGGVRGTTARLQGWCGALAGCVNQGACPPRVAWLTLRFLEAPEPPSLARIARASASSAAGRVEGALGAVAGALRQQLEGARAQAQAAGGLAADFAKQSPKVAQAGGQFGAKSAFSTLSSNPGAVMSVMKATVQAAAAGL